MGQNTTTNSCPGCRTAGEAAADEDLYHELRRSPTLNEIAAEGRRLIARGLVRCENCVKPALPAAESTTQAAAFARIPHHGNLDDDKWVL